VARFCAALFAKQVSALFQKCRTGRGSCSLSLIGPAAKP